jgi:type II secretory pathway predicted ATPase ExeA
LESYLKFKFARLDVDVNRLFDATAYAAIRERLIFTKAGNARQTVSLMYPLMVNNLVTGALNIAAELGIDRITNDVILEV